MAEKQKLVKNINFYNFSLKKFNKKTAILKNKKSIKPSQK